LGSVFLSKYANSITGADLDKDLVKTNNSNYKKIKNLQFKEFDLLKPSKSFVNKFDVVTGTQKKTISNAPSYTSIFAKSSCHSKSLRVVLLSCFLW
jgi:hypothetical protein